MNPPDPRESAPSRRNATVLESVEEIRNLVRAAGASREETPPTVAIPAAGAEAVEPFRPVERPPTALLTVIDEGDDGGERVRLRGPAFVIGRVEGDLLIPHDAGISGRHAEVCRRAAGGQFHWFLRDLQSTNGTFARASSVILHPGQEVLVGRTRLRFDAAGPPPDLDPAPGQGPPDATRKWQAVSAQDLAAFTSPSFVELTPRGEGRRFRLAGPEAWVGRDPKRCAVVIDDPTVSPRHARAYRDARNRWVLENARSLNGLWARVQEVSLDRGGQFQCGEQRFAFRVLPG